MIIETSFLNKLKDFGLNTYESKLWTALLSRGVSTAGELSDIANVPRSRSYDVLESLEKKGFIITKLGKPIKYIAVPPEEVLERVKRRYNQEAEEKRQLLDEIKSSKVLKELELLHNQGIELIDPSDLAGSIKGRTNVYNHLDSMIRKAEKNVILMTTTSGLIRKVDSLKKSLEKAAEKGVKIRIAAPLTKEAIKAAKKISKFAEIRHTDEKARFCLVDETDLTFMLLNDKEVNSSYDSAVWVKTQLFSTLVNSFFNSQWKKMKPMEQVKA